jgi:hypothetical protein
MVVAYFIQEEFDGAYGLLPVPRLAINSNVAVDEMKELANEWRDLQRSTSVKTPALDRLRSSIDQYELRSLLNPAEGEA